MAIETTFYAPIKLINATDLVLTSVHTPVKTSILSNTNPRQTTTVSTPNLSTQNQLTTKNDTKRRRQPVTGISHPGWPVNRVSAETLVMPKELDRTQDSQPRNTPMFPSAASNSSFMVTSTKPTQQSMSSKETTNLNSSTESKNSHSTSEAPIASSSKAQTSTGTTGRKNMLSSIIENHSNSTNSLSPTSSAIESITSLESSNEGVTTATLGSDNVTAINPNHPTVTSLSIPPSLQSTTNKSLTVSSSFLPASQQNPPSNPENLQTTFANFMVPSVKSDHSDLTPSTISNFPTIIKLKKRPLASISPNQPGQGPTQAKSGSSQPNQLPIDPKSEQTKPPATKQPLISDPAQQGAASQNFYQMSDLTKPDNTQSGQDPKSDPSKSAPTAQNPNKPNPMSDKNDPKSNQEPPNANANDLQLPIMPPPDKPNAPDIPDIIEIQLNKVRPDVNALSETSADILPYLVASLDPDEAIKAGYSVDEVIIKCTYNGKTCNISQFALTVDPNYGNCYTFNADGAHPLAQQPGITRGLSVAYFVGTDEYLNFIQTSGVRVVIHLQNETIFPDSNGFSTPTGIQVTAAIKQVQTRSMSTSKNKCAHTLKDVSTYNYDNTSLYSSEACLRSCYQASVIEQCQCGDPRVPLPPHANVTWCEITKRNCVNTYYEVDSTASGKNCSCPKECNTDLYDTTISSSGWPVFQEKFMTPHNNQPNPSSTRGNQLANIVVYFEDLAIVEYHEIEAYSLLQALWDLSAWEGLLLGTSVLSIFEIVNLMTYLSRKISGSSNLAK